MGQAIGWKEESYNLLFNLTEKNDRYRNSFFCALCGSSDFKTLPAILQKENLKIKEKLSVQSQQTLTEFITNSLSCYNKIERLIDAPMNLSEEVWTCYIEAICSDSYWLSADELLVVCALLRKSVAIFLHEGSHATLLSSIEFSNVPVCPIVLELGENRHRGHFSRISLCAPPVQSLLNHNKTPDRDSSSKEAPKRDKAPQPHEDATDNEKSRGNTKLPNPPHRGGTRIRRWRRNDNEESHTQLAASEPTENPKQQSAEIDCGSSEATEESDDTSDNDESIKTYLTIITRKDKTQLTEQDNIQAKCNKLAIEHLRERPT